MTENPRGQADRERWTGSPLEARMARFQRIFIGHPTLNLVIEHLNWRRKLLKVGGDPRGIMVLAPPDGGKTSLMTHLAELLPAKEYREQLSDGSWITGTEFPCICITCPSPCNVPEMGKAILEGLNSPLAFARKSARQTCDVINQLKLARTTMLVIDNAHDIPEQRGPVGQYNILSSVRDIIEEARVIVVMLGTDITETILLSNPQLHKRIPAPLRLGFYDVGTPDGLSRALRMLDALDEWLPFAEKSNLGTGKLGYGLACAGDGKIGTCCTILRGAFSYAVESGREYLTIDDVTKSYGQLYLDYAGAVNPFDDGFIPRRLILPGEPHFQVAVRRKTEPRKSAK